METFTLEYDLSMALQPIPGILTFAEDGTIRSESEGQILFTIQAFELEEVLVKAGVGCGLLYAKQKNGTDRILCRFTMSGLKKSGDFCKIVNYYIQTGTAIIPKVAEKRICEKCGQPLMEELTVCVFCYDKLGVLKRAFSYFQPYAKSIAPATILLVLSHVLFLTFPIMNRILIDEFLRPQVGTFQQIVIFAVVILVTRVIGEIMWIIFGRMYNRAAIAYCNDLRVLAYEKLQSHSMAAFSKRTPGDLIRRIMEDTAGIREFVTDMGRWAIVQGLFVLIIMIILLATDWRLTLMAFLPVPIVAIFLSQFWRFIRNRFERQWRKSSKSTSILHDIIKGIRTVKAFGNEEREIKKFAAVERELAQISSDNETIWARLFPLMTFFTSIGEFIILFVGGYAVINGTMSLGVLVQFTMFVGFIYEPLRWMVSIPRWLANATTSMVKVFEIIDEKPEITEHANPNNVPISGGVKLEGVSFGYKSYEPVLKSVDLEIKSGEMVGLVGKSGAGKSTLINLIMRLYDPTIGRVTINGTDIRDISPNHLHENIGVVFQDSFLFAGSYYDNIAYAKPDASYEEVIAAAKAANAHDFITKSIDGYNTIIGEGGESISGGERQRLAIARAIIKNPDILILDEATSSLDVETEAAIQESLNRLIEGRTTIAIAHRLSTLRNADRLVVLDKGGIAEVGTHIELLKQKGIYYNLVMAQRKNSRSTEAG